jgi:predicted glycosyltransferase involved in capsule biosynthesis
MKREQVLQKAFNLVHGPRAEKYGPPLTNHERIAAGFSVIFNQEVKPSQVVKALIWLKIARLVNANDDDSWVDIAGYAAIGSEIADDE